MKSCRRIATFAIGLALFAVAGQGVSQDIVRKDRGVSDQAERAGRTRLSIDNFIALASDDSSARISSFKTIVNNWQADDSGLLIEAARFAPNPNTRAAIYKLLAQKSGQDFGNELDQWYRWIWKQDVTLHPDYAAFKRELYRRIDPRFAEYFASDKRTTIRLDEIRWGGVKRDGIPPLSNPNVILAADASYLDDSDVVFGVSFAGKSRAYPKRILAWHEMVKDQLGGLSFNGVYCTLCGSMIIYETEHDGKHHELGTSGFLYRSNKLMYDHETKSLWSTLKGEPVVGDLVGRGIKLKSRYVVTTTWGQWKADHPDTDVLSLDTGHRRDYGEGVAYQKYFATDELMFAVPKKDHRLKNKDEVLIIRPPGPNPIAIESDFLLQHRIFQDQVGDIPFVVITDATGANRVYRSQGKAFQSTDNASLLGTEDGLEWQITEDALVAIDHSDRLERLPAHRAFWFGWYADHPDVRLIQ